jgi:thiamine biosynthesis lipoprotein
LVDIGGDTRCFGKKTTDEPWIVAIRDPFNRGGILCTLHLKDGAVCTSGNYERPLKIKGKSRNHIYDPRTGDPCDGCASATVVARDATTADAWATALSVLGPGGFKLLKDKNIEALLIMGNADKFSIEMTPGFKPYIDYRNDKYKKYFR